ncbi:transglycosylase domain-containing protein [Falsibacillus pallidus]|uniref:Penicillin-binding protein 1A n=1 Tax=Falsibacillus pallidus TaxID=493781 RepID=A0A370G2W4_9BACI|nr:transglycosylase domain-containing protein [Falsibacillus pallidus]RDI36934.1 penicillin-binding protein 1A [Falsibacillus pallidus]
MRTFTGISAISIMFILFAVILSGFIRDAGDSQRFNTLLDKKINVSDTRLPEASVFLDKNGQVFAEDQHPFRISLSGKDIPAFIKQIFITSEDRDFYSHNGFDMSAIARAFMENTKSSGIEQGGSTITQQLARNLFLNNQKNYKRKASEILIAYELENTFTKDQILEKYLNAIYFQHNVYGVEAAAEYYFSKPLSELSKGEMAFIAAIPNNPSKYDPYVHFKDTKNRQERLLDLLAANKELTAQEAKTIKQERINLVPYKKHNQYPDYASLAKKELRDLIAAEDGFKQKLQSANSTIRKRAEEDLNQRVKEVLQSGAVIHTSLDPGIQAAASSAVDQQLNGQPEEGAEVVIQYKDHHIAAVVGGKDYKEGSFNRAYQAFRQPGSAIKPLLDYGPYIETFHAGVSDKVSGAPFCENNYCPSNYSGSFYGDVSLKTAFTFSYNTPAIRLLSKTGIKKAFSYLAPFQFEQLKPEDYRLPAAIGGFTYGMTPLELTNAYSAFVNNGYYQPARAISKVTDRSGKILYQWHDKPVKVWSMSTAKKMKELMASVVENGTGRKASIPAAYIGGKTGTTNDYKDFWFIGIKDDLLAGVWVGRDIPSSMQSIESTAPHLKIWKKTMMDR